MQVKSQKKISLVNKPAVLSGTPWQPDPGTVAWPSLYLEIDNPQKYSRRPHAPVLEYGSI